MTCNHSFQDINELDSDCVACWKERAEKAEACCAEMRALLGEATRMLTNYNQYWLADIQNFYSLVRQRCASTDCGKGWMSPEKAKLLIEGIEVMWSFIKANEHDFSMSPNDERLIEQALAAVKEKP